MNEGSQQTLVWLRYDDSEQSYKDTTITILDFMRLVARSYTKFQKQCQILISGMVVKKCNFLFVISAIYSL